MLLPQGPFPEMPGSVLLTENVVAKLNHEITVS